MYSLALKKLFVRLDEIDHLRRLCRSYSRLPSRTRTDLTSHVNALTRSCVVLLCGHIQGFVEDLSDLILERIVADKVKRDKFRPGRTTTSRRIF